MRASQPIARREYECRASAAVERQAATVHAHAADPHATTTMRHQRASRATATTCILGLCAACGSTGVDSADVSDQQAAPVVAPRSQPARPFEVAVPGCTQKLALLPIAGARIPVPDGKGGAAEADMAPFWIASLETTWDMYDAFVFAMDRAEGAVDEPDAYTRPSKPYILMDRGFGHKDYPVISVSPKGASEFCKWLSTKTGLRFRLPSEAEWQVAARGDQAGEWGFAGGEAALSDHAWHAGNSLDDEDMRLETRAVGLKSPNALGLRDVHGNASEWTVALDGSFVAKGGSFKEKGAALHLSARRPLDASLNATDPQIPKSMWWLADGGFVGFRVVCEAPPASK
jgi:formylglycine-generating enzyme required for sulfatase activity